MRILITGGAGFIGSHIVEHFQGRADIRVLDNLRTGYRKNLAGFEAVFQEGSLTDRKLVRQAVAGVDYVFHLAAMISVPESMENPLDCVHINTEGTLILLEEAAAAGVKKLAFSTSAAVYGDNPSLPKRETMLPEPKSAYAITKLDGEYYCQMFARESRLATVSLRYFNVFGPRQDPASQYAAAVPIFINRALLGQPLYVFGDGEQTRDFIYVKDIVRANEHLIIHPGAMGIYNVAYGGRITINQLAENIIRLTGSRSEIIHKEERTGDVKHSRAAIAKLQASGFQPESSFADGLARTIKFFARKRGLTDCDYQSE